MKTMSTPKALLLLGLTFCVIMAILKYSVRLAHPIDEKLASRAIEQVTLTGYSMNLREDRGQKFRNHLIDWIDFPMRQTRVSYYDVNAIQPNDTLPKFTMTLIEVVFEESAYASEFVRAFNNSSEAMRNGNVAELCWNIAYISTKQMHFSDILYTAAYPPSVRTDI